MGAGGGTMMLTYAEAVRPLVRSTMSYLKTAVPGRGAGGALGEVRVGVWLVGLGARVGAGVESVQELARVGVGGGV